MVRLAPVGDRVILKFRVNPGAYLGIQSVLFTREYFPRVYYCDPIIGYLWFNGVA